MIHTAKQLKDKVKNMSGRNSEVAQALIRTYFMERFLERVSVSEYRNNFILKGGMLVASIVGVDMRATMDIDTTVKAFHSISAFCNAGFDLIGIRAPFSSLTSYSVQPVVNLVIMVLIVAGGIGFLTWEDIKNHKWHFKKYRMQSKVIFMVTGLLIFLPALYFFYFEFSDVPLKERVWVSLFQSVTPRTAGFNTADLTLFSEVGQMLIIMLMLIGGSPGSTAGGMKTTTLAVLVSSALSVFRKKEHTNFFGRQIPDDTIRNAATIFLMYIVLFLAGGMVISSIEDIPLMTALFETASAIGTVGLSLGITPDLGLVSHIILICLMFFGRVGGLTLIFATISEKKPNGSKYPQEKITVG